MNRLTKTFVIAGVTLASTASPAFGDDAYSTDDVKPRWTAASTESCADPDVAPLLSAFKDRDFYAPAPDGDFEAGATGWQLEGGASVSAAVGGLQILGLSTLALDLPVGASATSPTFCVDERYPHFRFSFAQASERADADVRVEVVYPGLADKNVRRADDLKAKHGRGWQLSDRIGLKPRHGLKRGGWRLVAIRIQVRRGQPDARVRVDDIVVDPRFRA